MNYINGLHLNNLHGDIFGGLTAAVVALPLAMAFGVASGAGAIAGLYGAIFVGFFAAILGGTPAQISGPTGPMTVVMALIFTQYTSMFPNDVGQGIALAFTVVVLGGFFQIIFGLLRIGKYIELVPHPVISGFMSGIGVIIIIIQFAPLLGQASDSSPLAALSSITSNIQNIDAYALFLGLLALSIVYGVPYFLPSLNRFIPAPLIALLIGTLIYVSFDGPVIPIIGHIPTGFPNLHLPVVDFSLASMMIASGLTLAALGAIDSLLTSLVADNITHTQHKPNRELVGQGVGNIISGLFGGLPGAGATMRTVVNVNAGGSTPISGALHAIVLLVIVLGAAPLASKIPIAVLAGILIKVGTDIIDWDYLKQISVAPKAGVVIMFTVLFMTVTIDLLVAVGAGMVMASFLFMKRMSELQVENISAITSSHQALSLSIQEETILDEAEGKILLFHLNGPMSFPSAKAMLRQHANITGYETMVLDLSLVPCVDFTSTRAIELIIADTKSAGRRVLLVGACSNVSKMLRKQKVMQHFSDEQIFQVRLDALLYAKSELK